MPPEAHENAFDKTTSMGPTHSLAAAARTGELRSFSPIYHRNLEHYKGSKRFSNRKSEPNRFKAQGLSVLDDCGIDAGSNSQHMRVELLIVREYLLSHVE
jgi:hypothetical protein